MPKRTRETPLTGKTKSGKILSEQQELFCNLYVQLLGNGTDAALGSYGTKEKPIKKNTANAIASENLRKPVILERIRELLDLGPLNEETVDSELSFLIAQKQDLGAKKGGIDIYNKMKGRYEKDNDQKKTEVNVLDFSNLTDEQLQKYLRDSRRNSSNKKN